MLLIRTYFPPVPPYMLYCIRRLFLYRVLAFCFFFIVTSHICSGCNVTVAAQSIRIPPADDIQSVPTFLDDTAEEILSFISLTTSFTAQAVIKQEAIGIEQPVTAECHIRYSAPSNLTMKIEGAYPYNVYVTATNVTTFFPLVSEKDVRPLYPGEKLWDDFLCISTYIDDPAFLRRFKVEDGSYVIYAQRKEESIKTLQEDFIRNGWQAVFRYICVEPRTGAMLEAHKTTLLNEKTTIHFKKINAEKRKKKQAEKHKKKNANSHK